MTAMTIRQQKAALRCETAAWQKAAIGLLGLAVAVNMALVAWGTRLEEKAQADAARYREEIESAERIRDQAVQELGALSLRQTREQEAREAQTAAYAAVGVYRYVGECTVTYYCPCQQCCGSYADGLTATGLPAGPGIVAVDPSVVPLGSTVIIDGQKYLAADTGVTGNCIDICVTDHAEALELGVGTAEVWVTEP